MEAAVLFSKWMDVILMIHIYFIIQQKYRTMQNRIETLFIIELNWNLYEKRLGLPYKWNDIF